MREIRWALNPDMANMVGEVAEAPKGSTCQENWGLTPNVSYKKAWPSAQRDA